MDEMAAPATPGGEPPADTIGTMSDASTPTDTHAVDLDAVERDLADVEIALGRLDAGTYWTDEVTGEPLPDDVLAANPTVRRLA
jgi:RNA polymerase-binding transcription factor DksA